MIIVSQDKKIINFENVTKIDIANNDAQKKILKETNLDIFGPLIEKQLGIDYSQIKGFGVYAYFQDKTNVMIGQYKTEERAKEVLQDIVKKYEQGTISCMIAENEWQEHKNVYEMPTE